MIQTFSPAAFLEHRRLMFFSYCEGEIFSLIRYRWQNYFYMSLAVRGKLVYSVPNGSKLSPNLLSPYFLYDPILICYCLFHIVRIFLQF